jgi:uncharacterized protein (DUF433 family)
MVAVAMKTITARLSNRDFTAAEVSAMLSLEPVEVSNLIAEIAPLGVADAGKGKRTVQYRGLFAMLVAKELVHCQLPPEMRAQTLRRALRVTGRRVSVPGTKLEVIVESYRKQANLGLRSLYEAEASVEKSRAIMQGEPCIKGTRIPAYVVAAIASAHGVDEALATYPSLKKHQVELASIWVTAHPRRGRPKKTIMPPEAKVVSKKVVRRKKKRRTGAAASRLPDR